MEEEHEYSFHGQRPGEKVIKALYKHPYVLYPPGFRTVFLLTIGIAVVLFWPKLYLVAIAIFVFCGVYFFRAIYLYKETIFLITNQRIFSIIQRGFFDQKIIDVELKNILDIQSETNGFAGSMLKYGNLTLRTAGANEGGDIIFENIPRPYNVQQIIRRAQK